MPLLDFSLRELGLIAEMLRSTSVREVARKHGLEPGNLSRLLKRLESECGEALAVRSRAGLSPTEAGRRLLTQITHLCETAATLEQASAAVSGPILGIGAVPFVNTHVVAPAIIGPLLRSKNIRLRLLDLQPDDLLSASLRGGCDVCLHVMPLDWPKTWETVEVGALTWRHYARASRPLNADQHFYIYPVYWARDGLSYGNDMHPVSLSRRLLGLGVSSADTAVRAIVESDYIGFLPDVVAHEFVQNKLLMPFVATGSRVESYPLFVSVRSGAVQAKVFKTLVTAIRQRLAAYA